MSDASGSEPLVLTGGLPEEPAEDAWSAPGPGSFFRRLFEALAGAGEAWAGEIERRAASVRERKVRLVDWKRARARLRKAIQKPPQ